MTRVLPRPPPRDAEVIAHRAIAESHIDEVRRDGIDMRLAEFVVAVTECSSRRALSLIRGASNETPLQPLAIALAATLADIRSAERFS
jgi:hypothetical protein